MSVEAGPSAYVPEWVTKTDVARRQLAVAIRLFFERRDPIAVHTLVAASHQVLLDLGATSGVVSLLKSDQSAEHSRTLNFAANFFKHADRDRNGRINVEPLSEFTAEFLMDAVVMLQRIDGSLPIEGKVFWSWFVTKHRDMFEGAGEALHHLMDIGLDVDDFPRIVALLAFHDIVESGETNAGGAS